MKKNILLLLLCLFFMPMAIAQTETEPNNSFSTSNLLTFSNNETSIQGAIQPIGDKDYYAIEVAGSGVIFAEVTDVPSNMFIQIELYDSNQNLIESGTSSGLGKAKSINKLVCSPGKYYVLVRDSDNRDQSSSLYQLRVSFNTNDVYECNNTFQTAKTIPIGENIFGAIYDEGDKDYYAIEVAGSGVIFAEVTDVPSNMFIQIELYDSNQNLIESGTSSGLGKAKSINKLVCSPGKYYIQVRDSDNRDQSSSLYQLRVSFNTDDVYECNNTFQTAKTIPIGENIFGAVYDVGDKDYYAVDISGPGVIFAEVTDVPSNMFIQIELYDSNQNLIESGTSSGLGRAKSINKLVCSPGKYYILVRDSDNRDQSSSLYQLKVEHDTNDIYECNNTFNEATSIEFCNIINATIRSVGDDDFYEFQAVQGEQVEILLDDVPSYIAGSITIYDASQNQLTSKSGNNGQSISFNFTPPSSGQYYLRIRDSGNNSSGPDLYKLTLMVNCNVTSAFDYIESTTTIHPNPSSGSFFLEIPKFSLPLQYQIINMTGQILQEGGISESNFELTIDAPEGVYVLRIIKNNKVYTKQISVVK